MAPGSANPLVEMQQLTNAHPREAGGGRIIVNLVIFFIQGGGFAWACFDPLIFPTDRISYFENNHVFNLLLPIHLLLFKDFNF